MASMPPEMGGGELFNKAAQARRRERRELVAEIRGRTNEARRRKAVRRKRPPA